MATPPIAPVLMAPRRSPRTTPFEAGIAGRPNRDDLGLFVPGEGIVDTEASERPVTGYTAYREDQISMAIEWDMMSRGRHRLPISARHHKRFNSLNRRLHEAVTTQFLVVQDCRHDSHSIGLGDLATSTTVEVNMFLAKLLGSIVLST